MGSKVSNGAFKKFCGPKNCSRRLMTSRLFPRCHSKNFFDRGSIGPFHYEKRYACLELLKKKFMPATIFSLQNHHFVQIYIPNFLFYLHYINIHCILYVVYSSKFPSFVPTNFLIEYILLYRKPPFIQHSNWERIIVF